MSEVNAGAKSMLKIEEIKQGYTTLCEKIDALSKRERVIVLAVLLVAVYGLIQFVLLDPQLKRSDHLETQLSNIQQKTDRFQQEQIIVNAQISAGPNKTLQAELNKLNKQLEKADIRLKESTVSLIPPALMPEVMQGVLSEIKGLRLLNLENRGAVLLTKSNPKDEKQEADNVSGNKLYRHSFVITLEGSYLATLTFFQALEKKSWKFFWQNMRYEVIKYPKAKVMLEVYTLSTEEDWIGV